MQYESFHRTNISKLNFASGRTGRMAGPASSKLVKLSLKEDLKMPFSSLLTFSFFLNLISSLTFWWKKITYFDWYIYQFLLDISNTNSLIRCRRLETWIHIDLKWEFATSSHCWSASVKWWEGHFSFVIYDISFVVY